MENVQNELASGISRLYPDAVVKKINSDNYLDIHLPQMNEKKGTHLFFNTSKGKIKFGFYCRDEEFNEQVLSKSENLEKYAQGIRLKENPEFSDTELAIEKAVEFINSILKGATISGANSKQKDAKFSKFFERIKAAYGRCSLAEEKNYASFTFKAAFLYELRVQKDIIRLLAANYPKKASIERSMEVIAKHEISLKLINNQFEIFVEEGKVSPDKLTVRIEIPYKKEDMESDSFIDKVISCCEEFHSALMPLINEFQPEPVGSLKEIMGGEKMIESSPTNREQSIPAKTESFIGQDSSLAPDQNAEDEASDDEDDGKGFPMLRFRKPAEDLKDVVNAYLKKWQKPSYSYAWRMGITAYFPEFVEELVSDDVCPVFTNDQIKTIYDKISNEKVIPILDYAPEDLYFHTKQVWWIVPFCIWKDDKASMIFVDKNGFYALLEEDGDIDIQMIFAWDKVDQLDIEYAADDDINLCRLTLYQDNGGYLTFDEFISEDGDDDHGSYLHVIEAIWEARRETIEASKGQSFWLEGEGGETFEAYGHPSELYKSDDEKMAEKITQLKTIIDFYIEDLTLKSESLNLLEYVHKSDKLQETSYIIEINNTKSIQIYFKTSREAYIKNAQNNGYLTKNFEWKDGLLKLMGQPSFDVAFDAVQSFFNAILFIRSNGNVDELDSDTAYYIREGYYGDHPFENIKYDTVIKSLESAKKILLLRRVDVKVYLKIILEINENAIDQLDSVLDFIRNEIEFRVQQGIKNIRISDLKKAFLENLEKNEIDLRLYGKVLISLDLKYQQVKYIQNFDGLRSFLEIASDKLDYKIVYLGLSEALQKDVAVLEYMLSTTRNVFSLFPEEVKKDKTFILNWIKKTQQSLKQAEDQKAAEPENEVATLTYEAANSAAGLAPHILIEMDDSLINDEEILHAALSSKYVSFIENLDFEKWEINKDWAEKAAKINIHSVHYLPEDLKNDVDVCKALLGVHLSAFNFFTEEMKRNRIVQTYALKKDGNVFFIFPDDLKCNKAFIKVILNDCYDNDDNRGHMIFAMCDELSSDQELIDLAVERNPSIFKKIIAPNDYTKDIFKHYLKVSPYIFKLVPEALQNDRDLMIAMLSGGFDGHKRKSLFKESVWFNDEAFALDLVKTSDYSYSLQSLREDFQSKPEIVAAFLEKFPEPEHIAVLPAKTLGIDFYRPLVDQNLDHLFFIRNQEIANNLLENYQTAVLEKVRYADLRFFDRMGALSGNPEVFKAFMQNPLISSRYLEQPGYYIEEDTALMEEIAQLLVHFQQPFFNDRYNKGVDQKGLSFESKNQDRLSYIQSLSGNETALFKLLLSDPSPKIREEAAKRITLDEAAFNEIMDKGVPIVTHYEYGKSMIVDQQDLFVFKGLLLNPIFEGLSTGIKEKLNSFIKKKPIKINKKIQYQLEKLPEGFLEFANSEEIISVFVSAGSGLYEDLSILEEGLHLKCTMEWNTGTYKYEIPVKKLIELLSNKPFSEITFEDLEDYEKELKETRDGNLSLSSLNSIDFADSDEIIELLKGTSYELSDEDLEDPDFFISDKMHDFYSKGEIADSEIRFYSLFELKFDHETFGTYFVNWHYHSHYYDNLKSAYDGNRYSEALEWGLKYLSIHLEDPISQYFDNLESIDKAAKDLGDILKFIAHSFEKEKKFTEAIEYYGYLLIVKPESDFAKAHLGICYSALEES